jgi:hypothetical protein
MELTRKQRLEIGDYARAQKWNSYRITEEGMLQKTDDDLQVKTRENNMDDGATWEDVGNVFVMVKEL